MQSAIAGVGKSELAKTLASYYFGSVEAMVRFDMSEYMERHTVSKLIGSPPGQLRCPNTPVGQVLGLWCAGRQEKALIGAGHLALQCHGVHGAPHRVQAQQ